MMINSKLFNFIYLFPNSERLDKFLARKLKPNGYSRTFLVNLINSGNVKVNQKVTLLSKLLLVENDTITVSIITANKTQDLVATAMDIAIIYEDDDVIVINKPKNLVVHPGAGNYDNTLVNGLLYNMKNLSQNNTYRPGIIHRLDKQTTGLLLVAKNDASHFFLSDQLQKRQIKRIYLSLVHGTIIERSGTIKAPIARDQSNRIKMRVIDKNAKMAVTNFLVLERFYHFTLVQCELETGRTHQIRVHMQWIKHPVFNDPVYYQIPPVDKSIGQYLHAQAITFLHPRTKKVMNFICEPPEYFHNKLQKLRKEKG